MKVDMDFKKNVLLLRDIKEYVYGAGLTIRRARFSPLGTSQ